MHPQTEPKELTPDVDIPVSPPRTGANTAPGEWHHFKVERKQQTRPTHACRPTLPLGGTPNKHRGALRGTPGSVCPQPEPNATELPSSAPISARAAPRRRRQRWWRGEEGARRPGPEAQVLRHVLWHVLRNTLRRVVHVLVLHVSANSRRVCVGGSRPGRRAAACLFWRPPLEDDACHDEHLHVPILRGAWVPPHEDDACHDEHLHTSVPRGTKHILRHVRPASRPSPRTAPRPSRARPSRVTQGQRGAAPR